MLRRRRKSQKTSSKLTKLTAKTSRTWTAAVMNLDVSQLYQERNQE